MENDQKIKIKNKLVETGYINQKLGIHELAAPPYQMSIFKKVVLKPYRRLGSRSYRTRLAKSVSKIGL